MASWMVRRSSSSSCLSNARCRTCSWRNAVNRYVLSSRVSSRNRDLGNKRKGQGTLLTKLHEPPSNATRHFQVESRTGQVRYTSPPLESRPVLGSVLFVRRVVDLRGVYTGVQTDPPGQLLRRLRSFLRAWRCRLRRATWYSACCGQVRRACTQPVEYTAICPCGGRGHVVGFRVHELA